MIYANTMNEPDIPVCEARSAEKKHIETECKERGIYDIAHETRDVLIEVMNMLDSFKHEIRDDTCPDGWKYTEPSCFRNELIMIKEMALAVKGDLNRLIGEFH